jgi:hypothetical protein
MFQGKELERLRLKKEQLVFRSDANRAQWISDWQRLQSRESWLDELFGLAGRHPLPISALVTVVGVLAAKIFRNPGRVMERIGQVGRLIPLVLALWRLFRMKKRQWQFSPKATPGASGSDMP